MKTTHQLHDLGQSLWLDNITRELLIDGTLTRYISELSVTGLTSNPSMFDHAIKNGRALVCGAGFLDGPARTFALELADYWNAHIEDWTSVRDTTLARTSVVAGYYGPRPRRI